MHAGERSEKSRHRCNQGHLRIFFEDRFRSANENRCDILRKQASFNSRQMHSDPSCVYDAGALRRTGHDRQISDNEPSVMQAISAQGAGLAEGVRKTLPRGGRYQAASDASSRLISLRISLSAL